MTDEMKELFKKLNVNEKRNEFSSLLLKTDKLLDQLLANNSIIKEKTKNYNVNDDLSESETLLFFYEDLWNIKNKLLALLILKQKKKGDKNV